MYFGHWSPFSSQVFPPFNFKYFRILQNARESSFQVIELTIWYFYHDFCYHRPAHKHQDLMVQCIHACRWKSVNLRNGRSSGSLFSISNLRSLQFHAIGLSSFFSVNFPLFQKLLSSYRWWTPVHLTLQMWRSLCLSTPLIVGQSSFWNFFLTG